MRSPLKFKANPISPSRLVSFSDGIFAIAITLLVFNLKVPDLHKGDIHRSLAQALTGMIPQFVTYVLTFLLIAVFWSIHHHMMNHIHHVDNYFIWLNIGYLMGVSFIPFPTALLGAYPDDLLSLLFYIGGMSFVSGMLMSMWAYAVHRRRLVEKDTSPEVVRHYFRRGIISQFFFIITIILALFQKSWGQHFLLFLIPIQFILQFWHKDGPDTTAGPAANTNP